MKICLYSPYIPKHVGGGEKYLFDVATVLAEKHQVSVAVPGTEQPNQTEIRNKYQQFLNQSLKDISFIATPLGTAAPFLKKLRWTKQFDLLYYVTDGSLFFSAAKSNILHIQFPLQLSKSGFIEQQKLKNWHVKNTNSEFTKRVVEKSWPVHIDVVHYPKVDVEELQKAIEPKEKIILNVGRFFRQLHSKRQDVLVKMFANLREHYPLLSNDWKLVLVGGIEDQEYVDEVKKMADGLPIEIYTDLSRTELLDWYGRASIYWHAAGFGIDEKIHPEKVEHFGISTVEAMAAGCVPLVHGKGGQVEVVGDELAQLLWLTEADCLEKTVAVMEDAHQRQHLAIQAQARATVFGPEPFATKLWQMVEGDLK